METRVSAPAVADAAGSGRRKPMHPISPSSKQQIPYRVQDTDLGHVSKTTEAHSDPLEGTVAERVIKTPLGVTHSVCSLSPPGPDIRFADKSLAKDLSYQHAHTHKTVPYLSCKLLMGPGVTLSTHVF
jgi:hypothetical protein